MVLAFSQKILFSLLAIEIIQTGIKTNWTADQYTFFSPLVITVFRHFLICNSDKLPFI